MFPRARSALPFVVLLVLAGCQDQLTDPSIPLDAAKGGGPKPPPSCTGLPGGTTAIRLTPPVTDLQVGTTIKLVATNQSGTAIPACALKWSSTNSLIATVSLEGVVSGVAVGGPVTIRAQTSGKKPLQATASVTVVDLIVATVEVTPSAVSLDPGATVLLAAVARNAGGQVLTGKVVVWTSIDATVSTVSSAGLVTATGAGDATITAQIDDKAALSAVRVSGWKKLADAPASSSMTATSTFDAIGRNVYVVRHGEFVAGSPDVWRYSLTSGSWEHLAGTQQPYGSYRQYQYDQSNGGRIMTFWDGLGPVHALPQAGGAWTPLGGGATNAAYYEGASFIDPVTGRLSLLMGYGLGTHKDTFWQFDGTSWGLRPTTNTPIARMSPRVAPDPSGNRVFLLGGHLTVSNNPTDVWSLDLSTLAWSSIMPNGQGPQLSAPWAGYVSGLNRLYVYGGVFVSGGALTSQLSDQLSYVDLATSTIAQVVTTGPNPGPRRSYLADQLFHDAPARRLILAAGINPSNQWLSDVWAYYLP